MLSSYLHIGYISLVVLTVAFFLRRRRFDALFIGAMATIVYFLPALFGSIQFPYGADAGYYDSPIVPGAYVAMLLVVATLVGVTFAYDRLALKALSHVSISDRWVPEILSAVMMLGFVVSVATIGKGYLCVEKTDMLARINYWYYVASYSAPLALVTAMAARKWWLAAMAGAMLFGDLFIGFRGASAVAFIGVCLLHGGALFGAWRKRIAFVLAVGAVACALFVVKQLAWNIKYTVSVACPALPVTARGSAGSAVSTAQLAAAETALAASPTEIHIDNLAHTAKMLGTGSVYLDALRYSEPMVIDAILNETVRRGFTIPMRDVVDQSLSGVPGGKSLFGIDVSGVPLFSAQFGPVLFPSVTFGMASNPWAQAYAAGGLALVFVFALVYASCLAGFAAAMQALSPVSGALVAVAVGWWGFYVHRNDVLTEAGIMKMTIYIAALAVLISFLVSGAAKIWQIRLGHR
jgi:hypothetical protein